MNVTSSIFEDQGELLNTAERDDVPDYLKSYQKAQAAALLSHSASATHQRKAAHAPGDGPGGDLAVSSGQSPSHAPACPSCNSCAHIRACAPVSSDLSTPRKKTSIFKLVASRLKRFGRKTLSGFRKPTAANNRLSHATAIALARREASNTGPDAKALRRR